MGVGGHVLEGVEVILTLSKIPRERGSSPGRETGVVVLGSRRGLVSLERSGGERYPSMGGVSLPGLRFRASF